jgi:hypothetical protein
MNVDKRILRIGPLNVLLPSRALFILTKLTKIYIKIKSLPILSYAASPLKKLIIKNLKFKIDLQ